MAARQKTQKRSNTQRKKNRVKKQNETQNKMPENTMVQEEIILVIAMAVSVILFLSNFNLSGKAGIYISSFTFGMIGILAYVLPFFIFFSVGFNLLPQFLLSYINYSHQRRVRLHLLDRYFLSNCNIEWFPKNLGLFCQ